MHMTSTRNRTPLIPPTQLALSIADESPGNPHLVDLDVIAEDEDRFRKHLSLVVLTLQNSTLVLVVKHSRTLTDAPPYLTTTAVLITELVKLGVCIYMAHEGPRSQLYARVFGPSWYLLGIPASLYTVQNNLQYLAMSKLDVATYAVTYQLKILTTAICSILILNYTLSVSKWIALVLLSVGVALVHISSDHPATAPDQSSWVGFVYVLLACVLSGLAGVYFEKIVKHGPHTSVWIRNVQLSLFSLVPATFSVVFFHGRQILDAGGFFQGYTFWTWLAILVQALGGLIVSMVVKYADNILKGFATSVSIILSSVVSIFLFGFVPSPLFVVGASCVILSSYVYSRGDFPSLSDFKYKPARSRI